MKKPVYLFILAFLSPVLFTSFSGPGSDQPLTDQYIVIAWNDLGMHCANIEYANMCILPPYNNQRVHVIRKGDSTRLPLVVNGTGGIYVTYEIPGNTYSAGKTNFWDYDQHLFGVDLPLNTGLTGFGLTGTMHKSDTLNYQYADGIPIVAFTDSAPGVEDPYQLTLIRAWSSAGSLLATTQSVIPVAHEINCVSSGCHSSELAILNKHDQVPGFNIANRPILCANCHADPALGTAGQPDAKPFSQVIHMKHGEFIKTGTTADCYKCHPGPNTQCWRDVMHTTTGMIKKCQDCHGSVYQVGKTIEEDDRRPWLDEPSCGSANCHGPQYAEEPGKLFRESKGHGGLYCSTCHNSPHAILPTTQPRDNVQNIALQGFAGTLSECSVCHGYTPSGPGPHGIPALKNLENITVTNGQHPCYNATQIITVAGGGTVFSVEAGGSATMIAGRKISMQPGTNVEPGGYLHGYITLKERYCGSVLPPFAPSGLSGMEPQPGWAVSAPEISIYPNPAGNMLMVEVPSPFLPEATLKIFDLSGREIRSVRIYLTKTDLDLSGIHDGMYLVSVTLSGSTCTKKLMIASDH